MANDFLNISKSSLDILSSLQCELHLTNGDLSESNEIISRFSPDSLFRKINWTVTSTERMKTDGTTDEKGKEITFIINQNYSFLINSTLVQEIPQISVKEAWKNLVEICWPRNLGHNLIEFASLKSDNDQICSFDNIWLDNFLKHYIKKKKLYNKMIGNVKKLNKWNNVLPQYPVIVPQPFYYSRFIGLALPICQSEMSVIKQSYKLKRKITDILRMRVRKSVGEEWNYLGEINEEYLNIMNNNILNVPILYGQYSLITLDEINKCYDEQPSVYYYEDIVQINIENPVRIGSKITEELISTSPVKCIFWVAENLKSSEIHNFSNYTTDYLNSSKGKNPCSSMKLTFWNEQKNQEESSFMFDLIEPYYQGKSDFSKKAIGYNIKSLSLNYDSFVETTGLVLSLYKSKITISLEKDNERFISFKELDKKTDDTELNIPYELRSSYKKLKIDEISNDLFLIKIRMIVIKKITFRKGKKPLIELLTNEVSIKHGFSNSGFGLNLRNSKKNNYDDDD